MSQDDKKYLFTSDRPGFRNWESADIDPMAQINADMQVMEFFPSIATREQTTQFIERMKNQFEQKSFCYFAVDQLSTGAFVGFIGLSEQAYDADFTPCIDIGWRLKSSEWGQGLATEGAMRCLDYAFENLGLEQVYAIAPKINVKSERVMTKIGMKKYYEFAHPLLAGNARLQTCVLYKIGNPSIIVVLIDDW
ncbi:GNAT family N-acetyltransferase [Niabella hibiscisoli]|uniref:GNAT family N-acetyltransferase n=1 Tax=Niabella hibiscisoli TaxID=1825928 RepID=UPI001F0CFFCE|nr:GNAT family N-acetyltransferase [Niabella hibiscisoli]MCH5714789.1 GNAT family N-acetyltransferase [Niabella hibiscisoli]